jgi:hypothetical protein
MQGKDILVTRLEISFAPPSSIQPRKEMTSPIPSIMPMLITLWIEWKIISNANTPDGIAVRQLP